MLPLQFRNSLNIILSKDCVVGNVEVKNCANICLWWWNIWLRFSHFSFPKWINPRFSSLGCIWWLLADIHRLFNFMPIAIYIHWDLLKLRSFAYFIFTTYMADFGMSALTWHKPLNIYLMHETKNLNLNNWWLSSTSFWYKIQIAIEFIDWKFNQVQVKVDWARNMHAHAFNLHWGN